MKFYSKLKSVIAFDQYIISDSLLSQKLSFSFSLLFCNTRVYVSPSLLVPGSAKHLRSWISIIY